MKSMNLTTLEVLDKSDFAAILEVLKQAISTLVKLGQAALILEVLRQTISTLVSNITDARNSQLFCNDKLQQSFVKELSSIGLDGILSGAGIKIPGLTFSTGGTPVYYNLGLANNVRSALDIAKNAALIMKQRPLFLNVYILTWTMGPSDIKQVIQQLGSEYQVVTPGTLLRMIAQAHSQGH